jgi:DNA-binding transcriptional ArsR family regulator
VQELKHLGQAIADPTRVLAALLRAEICVCELVDALEVGQSTLSSHLPVLRQTAMVITRKEGRWVYYSLVSLASYQAKMRPLPYDCIGCKKCWGADATIALAEHFDEIEIDTTRPKEEPLESLVPCFVIAVHSRQRPLLKYSLPLRHYGDKSHNDSRFHQAEIL